MSRGRRTEEDKKAKRKERRFKERDRRAMRARTAYKYPLENKKCEDCGDKAEVRHHISGQEDKVKFLCRNCHKLEHRKWSW